jgi:hypothetical protein
VVTDIVEPMISEVGILLYRTSFAASVLLVEACTILFDAEVPIIRHTRDLADMMLGVKFKEA